jgi:hypothetical protein
MSSRHPQLPDFREYSMSIFVQATDWSTKRCPPAMANIAQKSMANPKFRIIDRGKAVAVMKENDRSCQTDFTKRAGALCC